MKALRNWQVWRLTHTCRARWELKYKTESVHPSIHNPQEERQTNYIRPIQYAAFMTFFVNGVIIINNFVLHYQAWRWKEQKCCTNISNKKKEERGGGGTQLKKWQGCLDSNSKLRGLSVRFFLQKGGGSCSEDPPPHQTVRKRPILANFPGKIQIWTHFTETESLKNIENFPRIPISLSYLPCEVPKI